MMTLTIRLSPQEVLEATRDLVSSPPSRDALALYLRRIARAAGLAASAQLPGEILAQASLTCRPVVLAAGGELSAWLDTLERDPRAVLESAVFVDAHV